MRRSLYIFSNWPFLKNNSVLWQNKSFIECSLFKGPRTVLLLICFVIICYTFFKKIMHENNNESKEIFILARNANFVLMAF